MWNNSKGSFVLELIIALVILSSFILSVMPIVKWRYLQYEQKRLEITAEIVLYEQMLRSYKTGAFDTFVVKNNIHFTIHNEDGEYCAVAENFSKCLPSWEQ